MRERLKNIFWGGQQANPALLQWLLDNTNTGVQIATPQPVVSNPVIPNQWTGAVAPLLDNAISAMPENRINNDALNQLLDITKAVTPQQPATMTTQSNPLTIFEAANNIWDWLTKSLSWLGMLATDAQQWFQDYADVELGKKEAEDNVWYDLGQSLAAAWDFGKTIINQWNNIYKSLRMKDKIWDIDLEQFDKWGVWFSTKLNKYERQWLDNAIYQATEWLASGQLDESSALTSINSSLPKSAKPFTNLKDVASYYSKIKWVPQADQTNIIENTVQDKLDKQTQNEAITQTASIKKNLDTIINELRSSKYLTEKQASQLYGASAELSSSIDYVAETWITVRKQLERLGIDEAEINRISKTFDELLWEWADVSYEIMKFIWESEWEGNSADYIESKYADQGGIDNALSTRYDEVIRRNFGDAVAAQTSVFTSLEDKVDYLKNIIWVWAWVEWVFKNGKIRWIPTAILSATSLWFNVGNEVVQSTQDLFGKDFQSADLWALWDVDINNKENYFSKSAGTQLGEMIPVAADIATVLLPGWWSKWTRLTKIWDWIIQWSKGMNLARRVWAWIVWWTLKWTGKWLETAASIKNLVTWDFVNDVVRAENGLARWFLSQIKNNQARQFAEKALARGIRVGQELQQGNLVGAMIDGTIAQAYGGWEWAYDDVIIDTVFSALDFGQWFKAADRLLEGINTSSAIRKAYGIADGENLSLNDLENIGWAMQSNVRLAMTWLQTPERVVELAKKLDPNSTLTVDQVTRDLKKAYARKVVNEMIATSWDALLTGEYKEMKRLNNIGKWLMDDKVAAKDMIENDLQRRVFSLVDTMQSNVRLGTDAINTIRKANRGIDINKSRYLENNYTVKEWSVASELWLDNKIYTQSDIDTLAPEGNIAWGTVDDYFTKRADGTYVVKPSKYEELGFELDTTAKAVYDKMIETAAFGDKTAQVIDDFISNDTYNVLSKALGNVIC